MQWASLDPRVAGAKWQHSTAKGKVGYHNGQKNRSSWFDRRVERPLEDLLLVPTK